MRDSLERFRLTQTLGSATTTYGYGAGNDLLQTTSVSGSVTETIGYTADGRMASFSAGIASPGGQLITALSYNQDAQLSSVDAGSTTLSSYTYNGFGQRVLKAFTGGTGEIYQYGQNGMLLEETDQSGTPQADYIYLSGRPIATLNPATGTLYYLQDDRLGTPQLATDSNQTVAWQAAYGPFGQAAVSGSITQNLRFPGQYYDIETGWNHNGFRDYIPELGRYAEPDPLGRQGSARLYDANKGRLVNESSLGFAQSGAGSYAYVLNNPTNHFDPLGLCPPDGPPCLQSKFWNFFNSQYPAALPVANKYSVDVSLLLALAAHESGWATSPMARTQYNSFGATPKGDSTPGLTFNSFNVARQWWGSQYGIDVQGVGSDMNAFLNGLLKANYNSQKAPLGDPKWPKDVSQTLPGVKKGSNNGWQEYPNAKTKVPWFGKNLVSLGLCLFARRSDGRRDQASATFGECGIQV